MRTGRFIAASAADDGCQSILVPRQHFGAAVDDDDADAPQHRYPLKLLSSGVSSSATTAGNEQSPLRAYYVVPVGTQLIGPQTKRALPAAEEKKEEEEEAPAKRPAETYMSEWWSELPSTGEPGQQQQQAEALLSPAWKSDRSSSSTSSSSFPAAQESSAVESLRAAAQSLYESVLIKHNEATLLENYEMLTKLRTHVAALRQLPQRYTLVYECAAYCVAAMSVVVYDLLKSGDVLAKYTANIIDRLGPLLDTIYGYASVLSSAFFISSDERTALMKRGRELGEEFYTELSKLRIDTNRILSAYVNVLHQIATDANNVAMRFVDVRSLIERVASLDYLTQRFLVLALTGIRQPPLPYRIVPRLLFDPEMPLRLFASDVGPLECIGPVDLDRVFALNGVIGRGTEGVVLRVNLLHEATPDILLGGRFALKLTGSKSTEPLVYRVAQRAAAPQSNMVRMLFASRWLLLKPLEHYAKPGPETQALPYQHRLVYTERLFTVMLLEYADCGSLRDMVADTYEKFRQKYYVERTHQTGSRLRNVTEILNAIQQSKVLFYNLQFTVMCMVAQFRMQFVVLNQLFPEFKIGDLHASNVLCFSEQYYSSVVYVAQFPVDVELGNNDLTVRDLNCVHLLVVPLLFTNNALLKITDMGAARIRYLMRDARTGQPQSDAVRGAFLYGDSGTAPQEIIKSLVVGREQRMSVSEELRFQQMFSRIFAAPKVHDVNSIFYKPLVTRVHTQVELDIGQLIAQRNVLYHEHTKAGNKEAAKNTEKEYDELIDARFKQFTDGGSVVEVPDTQRLEQYVNAKLEGFERLTELPEKHLRRGRVLWVRMLGEEAEPIEQVKAEISRRTSSKKP